MNLVSAARVSPDGTVLDPGGFQVAGWARAEGDPAVASDGTNYLVVWDKSPDLSGQNRDILAARVSPTGEVLDPTRKARFPGGRATNAFPRLRTMEAITS